MHDVLPDDSHRWQGFEATIRQLMASYGYKEIRMPLVESTDLFCRSIGEVTDIVEKEMYTFDDRNGSPFRMLKRIEGQQVWNATGRTFLVQREVTFLEYRINPSRQAFSERRADQSRKNEQKAN
mgnify:CR=1 FL=1